jgi:hypothetical protein
MRSAVADIIWPDWQYPHCGTSSAYSLPEGVDKTSSTCFHFQWVGRKGRWRTRKKLAATHAAKGLISTS